MDLPAIGEPHQRDFVEVLLKSSRWDAAGWRLLLKERQHAALLVFKIAWYLLGIVTPGSGGGFSGGEEGESSDGSVGTGEVSGGG